ncbi:MAG TPA: lysylphosphatidylglycerol synthase transmembrane domain-containing protein [Solirubrobacteraceae bacterium]|nr:lysylphosphatidylglycerol synthase transmembrane domain-containing protein [Solirubrobacteraceae bacterium]
MSAAHVDHAHHEAPASHWHERLRRLAIIVLVVVLIAAAASLFGWDLGKWFEDLWNTITKISIGYLLAGIALITLQTTTTAYAWYSILRFAYGRVAVRWSQVYACYATAVALNFVLPANIGTFVMLLMFLATIAGATFAGVIAGYVVQKVFYTAIGVATWLYLFIDLGGSFSQQFGFIEEHPISVVIIVVGSVLLIALLVRILRARIEKWWEQAKEGGGIIAQPRQYAVRVLAPEMLSWIAMLGTIAVFLAAYDIPVSFHTLMRVVAGNSIANMTSVTPGGAGVVQGFNTLSLKGITSATNATAYSVAQQLVETAWSILLALVLLIRAFGWSGGRALVEQSYTEAKEKRDEHTAERHAKKA